jgi:hypothetical protein
LEYKKGDQWVEIPHSIGRRQGAWNWYMQHDDNSMSIEPKQHMPIAFGGCIKVDAKAQREKARRLHRNLPDPLTLRLTLLDMNGGSISIQYSYKNEPLSVKTLEKAKASTDRKNKPMFAFLGCDDTEIEDRAVVEGWFDPKDRNWTVQPNFGSTYFTMTDFNWKKYAYEAAKAGKEEYELENMDLSSEFGWSLKAWALVDLKHKRTYAVKFALKTNSGTATQAFLVQPEKFL